MRLRELFELVDAGVYDIAGVPFIYPSDAEGMPPPGPDMLKAATSAFSSDSPTNALTKFYVACLYNAQPVPIVVTHKSDKSLVPLIQGHRWRKPGTISQADVLFVGKMPGRDEMRTQRNFTGPSGRLLHAILEEQGLSAEDIDSFFVTNVIRWYCNLSTIPQPWINNCLPLLHEELRLVKPRIIVLLGDEAVKAVFGRKRRTQLLSASDLKIEIPVHLPGQPQKYHTAKVLLAPNPALIYRRPERRPALVHAIEQFTTYYKTGGIKHRNELVQFELIDNATRLHEVVDQICLQPGVKRIAIDLEWEGEFPTEPDAYVRTVQFSDQPLQAYVVKLRDTDGQPAFVPDIESAVAALRKLLSRSDIQLGGAHIAADIPWIESLGISVSHLLRVPDSPDAMRSGQYPGVFDVALAEHAYNETGPFDLEAIAAIRCGYVQWSDKLATWKTARAAELCIPEADLPGYGACPDEILIPYAAMDAAVTRDLMETYNTLLNSDRFGNDCWRAFHNAMRALPAFIEMHRVGVAISREQINKLTNCYKLAYAKHLAKLREDINWPSFNPRSHQQTVELLFGEEYTGKRDAKTGAPVRVRPEGALCLKLTPIKQTRQKGRVSEADRQAPSTDKETCGILALQHPVVRTLRDVRFLDHILKTVLRAPLEGRKKRRNSGMLSFIRADGRVHSFFRQLVETGRASSSRPPLQNLAKRREAEYARILGDEYPGPLRSIMCASPGYKLVEADFVLAELVCAAVVAREQLLLEHCNLAALPDTDPNHYDLHAQMAVKAFKLSCKPTKHGLAEIGALSLRVAAKNIIFGSMYGRTAEAVARQCREEGNEITVEDAQRIIDTLFTTYPGLYSLQEALRSRVTNEGWIRTCWGRMRRFYRSDDPTVISAQQREALNFPAQSMVADAMNAALHNLYTFPDREKLGYRIVLQQHDACILEVPDQHVQTVVNEVLPLCMHHNVTFKACNLDGEPYRDSGVYRMNIDVSVFERWGIPL